MKRAALEPSLRLGISSCLVGEEVRWNGGHKRDAFLLGLLGDYVEWFPVCPEVEIGLGTPRETIHLIGSVERPRLVGGKSRDDHTEAMQRWARERLEEIAGWNLHGFVLKRASPSCGLFRVKVHNDKGMPEHAGRGIFAHELAERFPLLPLEEEGRLGELFTALAVRATRGRHRNVLHHLLGFVKTELATDDKLELLEVIDDYAAGLTPLVVPLTLLKHHFRRLDTPDWLERQVYLHPHPKELMLRSHP